MKKSVLVIGAGCAGLAAAYRLAKEGHEVALVEKAKRIGGLSETLSYRGVRFDLGPHVFFRNDPEISALWRELLKEKFVTHRRRSSLYYNGKLIQSPLHPLDAFLKIGLKDSLLILTHYLQSQIRNVSEAKNSREWVVNNFGEKLYEMFYEVYNEKIWGVGCEKIEPQWARRRIKNSLVKMILGSFLNDPKFTVKEFDYPEEGAGMMHEAFLGEILRNPNASLRTCSEITALRHDGQRIHAVEIRDSGSQTILPWEGDAIISTMPINELVQKIAPSPTEEVLSAAQGLSYRNLIAVNLIIDQKNLKSFPQHWVDIHAPEIKMLRATNFGNFSPAMGAGNKAGVTAEYVSSADDELWRKKDPEVIRLAGEELDRMGLVAKGGVEEGSVVRKEKAYAVYLLGYQEKMGILRDCLARFQNLQTIGRQGMFLYNNMHHSVRSGLLAAENVSGKAHDLWATASLQPQMW